MADKSSAFNFNAEEYKQTRPPGEDLELNPLGENALLDKVGAFSEELLTGKLPGDVLEQLRINTGEKAVEGGLSGQIGRNLVARDLGLTSLDLKGQGASLAMGVVDLQSKRDMFDRELEISTAEYNEGVRQWNDKFASIMSESDLNVAKVELAGLELESRNRQFINSQETAIMLQNSEFEVPGAQAAIDALGPSYQDITDRIDAIFDKF